MKISKRSLLAVSVLTVVFAGAVEAFAAPASGNHPTATAAPRDVFGNDGREGGGGGHGSGGHGGNNPSHPSPHEPTPYNPSDDLSPQESPHGGNVPQAVPESAATCSLMGCDGYDAQQGKCTGCGND